jgi:transcriptional regulator with XRE-family HTH domain
MMLMSWTSPTVLRRRIASELRRLRAESGMSVDQVREEIGVSRSTMGRIERAEVSVVPANVEKLLRLYGVDDADVRKLGELAKAARKRGWWQRYSDVLPDWFQVYVGLEAEANLISKYESQLIPGILQTEDYARAVMRAERPYASAEEIERRVKLRMQRQQRDAPAMWLVLDEAALRRPVGGRDVMRAQLKRLAEVAEVPGNDVQIVEFDIGEHGSMGQSFTILRFADPRDAPMVYLENQVGSLYLEEGPEVDQYSELFEHIKAAAAGIRRSNELILEAIRRL